MERMSHNHDLDPSCREHPTGDCIIQELQGKLDKLKESYLATLDTHGRQDFMSSVIDLVGVVEEVIGIPPSGDGGLR